MDESDMEESDEDAEGSDEGELLVNPYPVEGIYKDNADRERCVRGEPRVGREERADRDVMQTTGDARAGARRRTGGEER